MWIYNTLLKMETKTRVQILDAADYVSLHANALGKSMNHVLRSTED